MRTSAITVICIIAASIAAACGSNQDRPTPALTDTMAVVENALPAMDSGAQKLLPVDEADASFRAFRDTLLRALESKDTTYLYSILAPEIRNSFGGDDSIAGFKRMWRMSQPPQSEVWETLSRALRMGSVTDGDYVIAPYVFKLWPGTIDPFEHVAVVRENAPVFASADLDREPTGVASYSILKRIAGDSVSVGVALPDGRKAWMRAEDVYSPVGWRAFFEKRAGRWTLTMFVAGD
jgi:hypothetical protein